MLNKFTVSLIQMDILPEKVEYNLKAALNLMKKALKDKSQAIILPEMWSTDFLKIQNKKLAESTNIVLKELQAFAKENNIFILSPLPELEKNKLYNTMFIISPQGKIEHKYRKIHLFKLTGEHLAYTPGQEKSSLVTPFGKWATAICFDLRYPDLIRELVAKDVDVLFVAAQWPVERKEHWENLLKARAIENQIFVVGVNRIGKSNGLEFPGTSLVFDPWGDLVAEGSTGEEVLTCQIDLNKIKDVRKKLPMS